MMSTKEYGDVLMIPDTVKLADLSNFFEPLGKYDELKDKYKWADQKMYDGTVYGLAHLGTVSGGICYNKKVWTEAGITEMPKTADEFIADLKKIKEKFPDVILLYKLQGKQAGRLHSGQALLFLLRVTPTLKQTLS